MRPKGDKVRAEASSVGYAEIDFSADPSSPEVTWNPILKPGRVVSGIVRDEDGRGVAGLDVDLVRDVWPGSRRRTRTDETGRFVFTRCPRKSRFRLEVFTPGNDLPLIGRERVEPAHGEVVELVLPSEQRSLSKLTGRIRDGFGRPVAIRRAFLRAVVASRAMRLTDRTRRVVVDASGSFAVEAVPPGSFELVVVADSVSWCRLQVPTTQPGSVIRCGELRLPVPGTARLRVTKKSEVTQLRFLLERLDVPQRIVERRGSLPERFRLAPGQYRLEVEMQPGPRQDYRFTVVSENTVTLNVTIDSRCMHEIGIVLPTESRPEFVWLEIFDEKRRRLAFREQILPDSNGSFGATAALLPGSYRMTGTGSDGRRGQRELLVNTSSGRRAVSISLK